jgi:hypothetical protein
VDAVVLIRKPGKRSNTLCGVPRREKKLAKKLSEWQKKCLSDQEIRNPKD